MKPTETFSRLPPEVTPETFLAVTLNDGQWGFIDFQAPYEALVEFINEANRKGAICFSRVGAEDLPKELFEEPQPVKLNVRRR